jgi:hypothetical protein
LYIQLISAMRKTKEEKISDDKDEDKTSDEEK